MRRALVTGLLVVTACAGSGQEPVPTPSTSGSTISTVPPSTTTTTTAPTSTTAQARTTTTALPELQSLAYEEVARLEFPVEMTALPGSDLSYIALKEGRVLAYDGSTVLEDPVLDINGQVHNQGERGFLSIALHPEETDRFFAHYSDNNGDTVVSEFTFSSPTELDPDSERILFTVDQPARNHNGGMITFYEGNLYLGLGDGGGSGDRFGNGQNTETLLGGLVRLSVDDDEADPILLQFGLRNPWRFWFDGDLIYTADVGQNAFEEVNVAPVDEGINYGWPITEGLNCFSSSDCDTSGIRLPVVEVEHGDAGTCSITGGIVYRAQAIPEIDGHYFYSDYCGGYLRSFVYADGEVVDEMDWTDQVGEAGSVTGFGIDGRGEMYVATTEALLKVVPNRGE